MSIHFHKLVVSDVRRETPECVSVAFELPDDLKTTFQYQPGQNITIRAVINDVEVRRSYSICSGPHEHELRIAVKEAPGGVFSAWTNKELVKGHVFDVLPPTGRFSIRLDPTQKKSYLAIAAGSGITPILSIISAALNQEPASSFTLIYGNRDRGSIIFREQLLALKNRFMDRFALHHILSREQTDADIYSGRITALKCEELSAALVDFSLMDEIFICGPGPMIFDIKDWLLRSNIDAQKIHYELFSTPVPEPSAASDTTRQMQATMPAGEMMQPPEEVSSAVVSTLSNVTIKLDGNIYQFDLPFDGDSILEAALQHGADLPFSCKGGVCSTCRARVMEGEVQMELNYALEPDEVAAGFILCCQSHPVTDKVVIDFDQK